MEPINSNYNLYELNNWMNLSQLIKRLYTDSMSDTFYQDGRTLVATLDAIFTNIALLARGTYADDNTADALKQFLLLLAHILDTWHKFPQNKDKLDKTRLCEILWIIMNGPESKIYLIHINAIVREVLENFSSNDDSNIFLILFKECLQKSMANEELEEVVLLVITVLNLELYNEVAAVKDWILTHFPRLFISTEAVYSSSLYTITLQCLEKLYKLPNCRHDISTNLFPVASSFLIKFCRDSKFREYGSRIVLTEMIFDFAAICINVPWQECYPSLTGLVQALPDTVYDWWATGNDVFFLIALIFEIYEDANDKIWSLEYILHAIYKRVTNQEIIVPPVLKAMCYFFPKGVNSCGRKHWLTETSYRLINRLEHSGAFHEVISPLGFQLNWILKSKASEFLKFMLLEMWLKEEGKMYQLCTALRCFALEDILLEYMLRFPKNPLSKKAAIVAGNIESATLPKKITITFFQNLCCMDLCSKLLLAKPAIPSDTNQRLAFCTALGAILPRLQDRDAFVACCSLCTELIYYLRDEPNAMMQFCQEFSNVKVIVGAAVSTDDDVAINAADLLSTLLEFQIRHNLKFVNQLDVNLPNLIKGSDARKRTALELIKLIVRFRIKKTIFLNCSEDISFRLYQKLHDFCGTDFSDIAYQCMLRMLKADPDYLTFSAVTYALMEIQWNCPKKCAKSERFLMFANCWFQYVQKSPFYYIPQGMKECILVKLNS